MKKYEKGDGNISVLHVEGDGIAEAWENSLLELANKGSWYEREGDKDKGRMQVDSTTTIVINNPLSRPFYHKSMTCGWENLLEYQMEMFGAKNSWMDTSGETTRWPYHYSERLFSYPGKLAVIDQIEEVIKKIAETPHKRNIKAGTWVPERDLNAEDPPCLQEIWFSAVPVEDHKILNMSYLFRSRNAMIAAPMNMLGLATLQAHIARKASERSGKKIVPGRMVDTNWSYHVRADNLPYLSKFLDKWQKSIIGGNGIEDRSYETSITFEMMEEARAKATEKIIAQTANYLSDAELKTEAKNIRRISDLVAKINGTL